MSDTCKGCGAPIAWVKTRTSKAMPVDIARVVIVTDNGEVITGRASHFATCPQADRFRRGP